MNTTIERLKETTPAKDIVELTKQRYIDLAICLAKVILDFPQVKKVAIFGSVLKQELIVPGDIDIVLLVDDDVALLYARKIQKSSAIMSVSGHDAIERMGLSPFDVLGFTQEQRDMINEVIAQNTIDREFVPKIDFSILSVQPSHEYVNLITNWSIDPNLLVNIGTSGRAYNSETSSFVDNIFSEESMNLFKEASFSRLKEVVHDPQYLEVARKNLAVQKRFRKSRLKHQR